MGNIMPLKYMNPTEASFAKRFYHFCPILNCNNSYFEDMTTNTRKRRKIVDEMQREREEVEIAAARQAAGLLPRIPGGHPDARVAAHPRALGAERRPDPHALLRAGAREAVSAPAARVAAVGRLPFAGTCHPARGSAADGFPRRADLSTGPFAGEGDPLMIDTFIQDRIRGLLLQAPELVPSPARARS